MSLSKEKMACYASLGYGMKDLVPLQGGNQKMSLYEIVHSASSEPMWDPTGYYLVFVSWSGLKQKIAINEDAYLEAKIAFHQREVVRASEALKVALQDLRVKNLNKVFLENRYQPTVSPVSPDPCLREMEDFIEKCISDHQEADNSSLPKPIGKGRGKISKG